MKNQAVKFFLRARSSQNPVQGLQYNSNGKEIIYYQDLDSRQFEFTQVYTQQTTQTELFEMGFRNQLDRLIEGQNCTILAYGAAKTGKTYTLFGLNSNQARGFIPRTAEYLFEQAHMLQDQRQFTIKVSFYELILDQVKDLGRFYCERMHLSTDEEASQYYLNEDVLLVESADQIFMENLVSIPITSAEEIGNIYRLGIDLKEQYDHKKRKPKSHTVFELQLNQDYREQGAKRRITSTISFVELSQPDIPKRIREGEKNFEFMHLNNSLSALSNVIQLFYRRSQGKKVEVLPFKESLLTQLLQHNLKQDSCLSLYGFIIDDAAYYQDIMNTLMFVSKFKRIEREMVKKSQTTNNVTLQQVERVTRLESDVSDLKVQTEKTQVYFEQKIKNFTKLMGIEEDLINMINSETGSKHRQIAQAYREAIPSLKMINLRNQQLEQRLDNNRVVFEEIKRVELSNQEKFIQETQELKKIIDEIQDQMENIRDNTDQEVQQLIFIRAEELQKLLIHSHMLLEEKAAVIHNLHFTMDSHAADVRNLADMLDIGKNQVEQNLVKQFRDKEFKHAENLDKISQQHEDQLEKYRVDIENYYLQCKNYKRAKKQLYLNTQNEAADLYAVILNQRRVIDNIVKGQYNNGIKPVLIPDSHYPQIPNRHKFQHLFRCITNKKHLTNRFSLSQLKIKANDTAQFVLSRANTPASTSSLPTLRQSTSRSNFQTEESTVDLSKALNVNLSNIRISQAKQYLEILQQNTKQLKNNLNSIREDATSKITEKNKLVLDLQKVKAEKEKAEKTYTEVMKEKLNAKVIMDSQKRLLNRQFFITERLPSSQLQSRVVSRNSKSRGNLLE